MQIQLDSPQDPRWTAEIDKSKKDASIIIQEDIIETDVINIPENITAIIGALFFFSILGALIRIGLNRLETYDGQPVVAIMYAQFVGCLIIGFLLEYKIKIETQYHTLFVGLSTGLCGSVTTFSEVVLGASKEFYNVKLKSRDTFQSILGGISVLLVAFSLSFIGFYLGRHAALAFITVRESNDPKIRKIKYLAAKCFSRATISNLDYVLIIAGIISYATAIAIVSSVTSGREITFAMVFGPIGTLFRWRLGKLNPRYPNFPLGTFVTNILGVVIACIVYILAIALVTGPLACDVMSGLLDGFCGCFTTISTWVVEVSGLERKKGYVYGSTSIVIAQVIMALGFGIYVGIGRVDSPHCAKIF